MTWPDVVVLLKAVGRDSRRFLSVRHLRRERQRSPLAVPVRLRLVDQDREDPSAGCRAAFEALDARHHRRPRLLHHLIGNRVGVDIAARQPCIIGYMRANTRRNVCSSPARSARSLCASFEIPALDVDAMGVCTRSEPTGSSSRGESKRQGANARRPPVGTCGQLRTLRRHRGGCPADVFDYGAPTRPLHEISQGF